MAELRTSTRIQVLRSILNTKFQPKLHSERERRGCQLQCSQALPDFPKVASSPQGPWRVASLPRRLHNRHLDLGDVSPANLSHFQAALAADVQGIQVDFDDGHCPSWSGQLRGLHAVLRAAKGQLPGCKPLPQLPVLMLRPRAWNMTEQHATLNGQGIPGALFDFGLLIFHIGTTLFRAESGPFFYLSKLESAQEARLWNQIFVWTQDKLGLPQGSIKACVLIENILSAFEMEEILYELRDHSLGLNCGIWDYAASIINKLGHRPNFVLPDRNRYVDVRQHFLRSYMALVVSTCHKRGAPATGGMAALLVPENDSKKAKDVIQKVVAAKRYEIEMGLDGFMVYDTKLVPHMNKLWRTASPRSLSAAASPPVTAHDLLRMPPGGVTLPGLAHNVAVSVLFVSHWLRGHGHFAYLGAVEDSATAEISRSQVWQWIHHRASIEDSQLRVTLQLVKQLVLQFLQNYNAAAVPTVSPECLQDAANVLLDLVATRNPPEFITSHLNNSNTFQALARKYAHN